MANTRTRNKRFLLESAGKDLTFFRDYENNQATNLVASYPNDMSKGSPIGTFTANRDSTTPATYVDKQGKIQVVTTSNIPRMTSGFYSSTGFVSRPGLIVEGAGTNILPRSDGSSSAGTVWTSWSTFEDVDTGTTTYDNANAAPSGISGAKTQRLVGSNISVATTRNHYIYYQTAAGTLANATTYTASCLIKVNSIIGVNVRISVSTLNNPVTAIQESFQSSNITEVTNGWVRIQKTFTTNDLDTSACYFRLDVVGIDAGDSYDVEFYAPQLEASPFATTFIPTTTAALTRNAETMKYPASGNRTNGVESIFYKYTPFANTSTTTDIYILDTDSLSGELIPRIRFPRGAANSLRLKVDTSSILDVSTNCDFGTSMVLSAVLKYNNNPGKTLELYRDGSTLGSSTTNWTISQSGTNFTLGLGSGGGVNGIISSIAIFSDAKSAGDVLKITEILNLD